MKKVSKKYEFGEFCYLIQNRYDLKAEKLLNECKNIIYDNKYKDNARELKLKIKSYNGARQAIEIIEKNFK